MKFQSRQDIQRFLVEVDRLDLVSSVTESFQPTSEMMEEWIKRRRDLLPGLKDFRRSQTTKAQWRTDRSSIMKGIDRFHKSTKGKKFHRALGRFNATRLVDKTMTTNAERGSLIAQDRAAESLLESTNIDLVLETLKALSSLKTHAFIELEYYRPLTEELEFRVFLDELLGVVERVEKKLLSGSIRIDEDDLEFLLSTTNMEETVRALAEQIGRTEDEVYMIISTVMSQAEQAGFAHGTYDIVIEKMADGIAASIRPFVASNSLNESHL